MSFLVLILRAVGVLALVSALGAEVRVVSQTVGTDELLLAVAGPEQIVALSHLARDPVFSGLAREAASYPQLKFGDAETVLKFHPTLVLFADYSRTELVEQVRRAGVAVIVFEHYATLDHAHTNLRRLAAALGPEAEARADRIIRADTVRLVWLKNRLADATPVRVIAPSTYGVIAGRGTTFQDLCERAAAVNLAATLGQLQGHAAPPREQMLQWSVERVVLSGDTRETALAPYRNLPPYHAMAAVREGRAVVLPPWMLGCVSHLRVAAYERLARELHPERFSGLEKASE
jgi:iron complex transport system substrate-binding protein